MLLTRDSDVNKTQSCSQGDSSLVKTGWEGYAHDISHGVNEAMCLS